MNLRLNTLGRFSGTLDGRSLEWLQTQRHRAALLVFLGVERVATRDRLVGVLWPESDPERARRTLNQTVYQLRQSIAEDVIETQGDRLTVASWVSTDLVDFSERAGKGEAEQALQLYVGAFLAEMYLVDTKPFEEWVEDQRARAQRLHRTARREAIRAYNSSNNLTAGTVCARQWVEREPLEDEAQHALIDLLFQSGHRSDALHQYELYRRRLADDHLEPLDETKALVTKIRGTPHQSLLAAGATFHNNAATVQAEPALESAPLEESVAWRDHMRRLIAETHRRSLWQVFTIYGAVSWGAYLVINALPGLIGVPTWVPGISVVLFLIGLPIVLATAFVQEGGPGRASNADPSPAPADSVSAFSPRRFLSWKHALLGGLLAFLVLATSTAAYLGMRTLGLGPAGTLIAHGALDQRPAVVLADFGNGTTDRMLGHLVTEALRIDLVSSNALSMTDPAVVRSALQRMQRAPTDPLEGELAREVALRINAPAIIAGEIGAAGNRYLLIARIVSASDGETLEVFRRYATGSDEVLNATARLSRDIRAKVGESLRRVNGSPPLEQVTTRSMVALRKYTQAVRLEQGPEAMELLHEAVAIDSTFAMAWRKLGGYLANLQAPRSQIVNAHTAAYRQRAHLTDIERLHTEADYFRSVKLDVARSVVAYREILDHDPRNGLALHDLTVALNSLRQFEEAEKVGQRGIQLPEAPSYQFFQLFAARLFQGRDAEARATLLEMNRLFPNNPNGVAGLILVALFMGNYAEADSLFDRVDVSRSPGGQERHVRLRAFMAAVQGQPARAWMEATRLASTGAAENGMVLNTRLMVALTDVELTGNTARARQRIRSSLADLPLDQVAPLDLPWPQLAFAYTVLGDTKTAESYLDRARKQLELPGAEARFWYLPATRARLALLAGRNQDAIEVLRRAKPPGCFTCLMYETAHAFDLINQPDSALAHYERFLAARAWAPEPRTGMRGKAQLRVAELYDAQGNREKAILHYQRILAQWKNSEPELAPRVNAIRQRLRLLETART